MLLHGSVSTSPLHWAARLTSSLQVIGAIGVVGAVGAKGD